MISPSPTTPDAPSTPIRVLIAEDHELTRDGLSYALPRQGAFTVVGCAENGQKAVTLAQSATPDAILMDIGMPQMDGIAATKLIKEQSPDVKVLMLTSHQYPEEVFAALASGADAYCLKDTSIERLAQIIQLVCDGGTWLDPVIAEMVLQALPQSAGRPTATAPEAAPPAGPERVKYRTELTERELDVLREIVNGRSNKEIAQALEISLHTVKTHVCNIIQKLAVDDRTQAAIKALRDNLV